MSLWGTASSWPFLLAWVTPGRLLLREVWSSSGHGFICLPCPPRRSMETPPRGWSSTSGPRTPTATPCVPTASVPAACCSGSGGRQSRRRGCRGPRPTPRSHLTWISLASSPPFTDFKVTTSAFLPTQFSQGLCPHCLQEPGRAATRVKGARNAQACGAGVRAAPFRPREALREPGGP